MLNSFSLERTKIESILEGGKFSIQSLTIDNDGSNIYFSSGNENKGQTLQIIQLNAANGTLKNQYIIKHDNYKKNNTLEIEGIFVTGHDLYFWIVDSGGGAGKSQQQLFKYSIIYIRY